MKIIISKISKMKLSSFVLIGATTLCFAFIPMGKGGAEKWVAPADANKKTNPVPSNEKSIASGKALYGTNCATCHGKKGKGDGPKSEELDKPVRDFTTADFGEQTDGAIFWKITEGKKPMPSFKKELTEEQRWTVINYIKEFAPKKK